MITLLEQSKLAAEITEQVKMAAIKAAKDILDADITNAMFYGSQAAYDKLTGQAQRITSMSASGNRGIINALSEIIAAGATSEKMSDAEIIAAVPKAIEYLSGARASDKISDSADRQLATNPEFQKITGAMLEKVAWQVLNGEIQVEDPSAAKQIINDPNGYILTFARVIVRDGITDKSTEEDIYNAIRKVFPAVTGTKLAELVKTMER